MKIKKLIAAIRKLAAPRPQVDWKLLKEEAADELFNLKNDYHHKSEGKIEKYMSELERENKELKNGYRCRF